MRHEACLGKGCVGEQLGSWIGNWAYQCGQEYERTSDTARPPKVVFMNTLSHHFTHSALLSDTVAETDETLGECHRC